MAYDDYRADELTAQGPCIANTATTGPFTTTEAYQDLGMTTGYAAGINYLRDIHNAILGGGRQGGICGPNNHRFDCRHEIFCYCGQTCRKASAGQVVSEGL